MSPIPGGSNSGKYYTDCYLKYRKWTLQETTGKDSKFSIKSVLAECIEQYDSIASTQGIPFNCWSPIHLAALLNDVDSIRVLVRDKGIDVDAVYTNTIYTVTPLGCAGYAGGMESMEFLIANGADAFKYTKSLVFWTVKGESIGFLRKLFEMQILDPHESPDFCFLIKGDALRDNLEILQLILKYFPQSAFQENHSGQTTVYLAAQKGLPNVLKQLIKTGVSVNKRSKFGLGPLYAVVHDNFSGDDAFNCLEILLDNGARLDYERGATDPLFHAAMRGFSKCVFELIRREAIINMETLAILNEKISNFVQRHLDGLVTLRGLSNSYSKILVSINLRFTGTINSSLPNLRETSFLNFLIEDGQHKFLLHPVIETYLTIKWKFVRKFFIASITLYISMLIFFSWVMIDIYVPDMKRDAGINDNGAKPSTPDTNIRGSIDSVQNSPSLLLWVLSMTTIIGRICLNIARLAINPRLFVSRFENWIQMFVLSLMIIAHFPMRTDLGKIPKWQSTTTAIAVFGAWAFFLNFLRRHPTFGIYVEMLHKVIINLVKLLVTYASLLIGYAISFMILYEGEDPFESFPHSMLRVLNMMVGEMGFDSMFTKDQHRMNQTFPEKKVNKNGEAPSHSPPILVLYALFILLISIALINLLIGLAVSDIKGLRKRSQLNKTMREIGFIVDLESFLFSKQVGNLLPKQVSRYLRRCIQLPASYNTIHVYPNDSNDTRLPKLLKQRALNIALKNDLETKNLQRNKQEELEAKLENIQTQLDYLVKRKQGM